jgi:hypothetical protein
MIFARRSNHAVEMIVESVVGVLDDGACGQTIEIPRRSGAEAFCGTDLTTKE